jgi:hypothetical protein
MRALSHTIAAWTALAALLLTEPAAAASRDVPGAVLGTTVSLPPAVSRQVGALLPLGAGEMTWFGLKIYAASLWVTLPRPQRINDGPFALAIRYERQIPGARLVDTSIDEMARMGFGDEAQRERWRGLLSQALPSVAPGETLVGLNLPGSGARFWHNGRLTAEINDEQLARAFFAIWLDERTREPELRARLLGKSAQRDE